jgi:filamentous hemagglutinin family protein
MKQGTESCLRVALLLLASLPGGIAAEVVMDGSLGPGGALGGPDYAITQDLGKTVGSNLFQSFSRFNISNGESATFSGNSGINNIISRVTGGSRSSIDGLVRSTIPGANFYFINPYGVVFGPNASIDVGGSFNAGTADYIALDGTGRFDAINPDDSVLTVDPPSAFGFYAGTPAGIEVGDALLQTEPSQTLYLAGGDIDIDDGNLYAPDGQVVLTSVASAGEVPVDPAAIDLDGFQSLGTIRIANPSGEFPFIGLGDVGNLDVTTLTPGDAAGGGRIVIRSGDFFLDNGKLRAEVIEDVAGGGIDIQARGAVALSGDAQLLTRSFVFSGNAGPVNLEAGTLTMTGDAIIRSDTVGTGTGGTVTVTADGVVMADATRIAAGAQSSGAGGSVVITTGSLAMTDHANVKTSTFGGNATGNAGDVTIRTDSLVMEDDATINTSTELGSQGHAGRVGVQAGEVQLEDAAWIISFTETPGDAGRIEIGSDRMTLQDQSVVSTTTFSSGAGGTILIDTGELVLSDAAVITSGTEGSGPAGNVIITADSLTGNGDAIVSSESEGGNFYVRGDADLSEATGGGDGGTVQVSVDNVVLGKDAGIFSGTGGSGAGGNVELAVARLKLNGDSQISAVSTGTGVAGNIGIQATNKVELEGGAITTETLAADGGNIHITANQLVYLLDSVISTSVEGGLGDGGNITIDPVFVILNNSSIIANAHGGNGGNILIIAENFFQDQTSIIEASSDLGINGTIVIKSPEEEVSNTLAELPESLLEDMQLVSNRCDLRTRKDLSSLVVVGRDGLPSSPDDYVTVRVPSGMTRNSDRYTVSYPQIRLGHDYRPGELLVFQCLR